MELPAPNLDSRSFQQLVAEARARIPSYTPEWTNLNDSDPGMTLVKLHAWMTETILHELNRVPELNYLKFLDLLGVTPMPAHPARTELAFTLDKLDTPEHPLTVPVPYATKVAVDDPGLPRDIVFETDRTLVAVNAHVAAVLAHSADPARTHSLVTRYDGHTTWLHSFHPFDPEPVAAQAGGAPPAVPAPPLYLGLLLRPTLKGTPQSYADDRWPAGPLDLYVDTVQVDDRRPDGTVEEGPLSTRCAAAPAPGPARRVVWQVYTGGVEGAGAFTATDTDSGWTTLAVTHDATLGLVRSGHLVLELPAGATPLSPALLHPDVWTGFGATRPPRTVPELIEALRIPGVLAGLAEHWPAMGVEDDEDLAAFAACGESVADTEQKIKEHAAQIHPERLAFEDWTGISDEFDVALPTAPEARSTGAQLRPLYWLRAKLLTAHDDAAPRPPALLGLHLNTVPATQAATRVDDALGVSTGRPAQTFTLPRTPVLIDPVTGEPDLELVVTHGGDSEQWTRRDDFLTSQPGEPHYLLDPTTGRIAFGDGVRGRIPVTGARIAAARTRTGGGAIGNVPPGTITRIKGRIHHVKGVTNPRAAHDGTDAEPLEQVKLRAPSDLRTRDRAVSAQDFADLALRTPGASLHKAYALAHRAPLGPDRTLVARDGAVTVVVLPKTQRVRPQPSDEQLRAVCRWLEPRRLLTTELHVVGPRYTDVSRLGARVTVRSGYDLIAVQDAVVDAVSTFLHPITGGGDGTGWPFGEDVYHGDLYDVMLGVAGVRRVQGFVFELTGTTPAVPDVTPVAEGHLPALPRAAVDVVTGYE
jgi:hypothetical protein